MTMSEPPNGDQSGVVQRDAEGRATHVVTKLAKTWTVGSGGWCELRHMDLESRVFVRFGYVDGRLAVVDLMLRSTSMVSSSDFRALSIRELERDANGPLRNEIEDEIETAKGNDSLETLAGWSPGDHASQPSTPTVTLRIDVPGQGHTYPSEFYESFAAAWMSATALGNAPAKLIADANEVAPKTVHGWARQARKRGLLSPGRKPRKSEDD